MRDYMKVLALEIHGFRGISHARLILSENLVFIGPNGSGKSTIVDALSLVFGRQKLVRDLTEHDFTASCPQPEDRIRIIATLGGFLQNTPAENPQWFRQGRAVPKWWNPETGTAEARQRNQEHKLCMEIGYAARFDHEELKVEQIRYFHDDFDSVDPFMEEGVAILPYRLLSEIGFYVLPARRTWASTISFGSELFRRAVTTLGGVPAASLLRQRDRLRNPSSRLEDDPAIEPLVGRINSQIAKLVPGTPRLQLRLTYTDSESLLQTLVPHFERDEGTSLPVGRHGTGLISLQTIVLLLEIGRFRKEQGLSFLLAMEEPELHVPPGLQRRLIGEATGVAEQVICTTHSPRVAAFFKPQNIQLLMSAERDCNNGEEPEWWLEGRALAPSTMVAEPNAVNQLFTDDRTRLVEALMFPVVLVPEGRTDFEWLKHLLDVAETGDRPTEGGKGTVPPFGSVIGVIPTRGAAIRVTVEKLRRLHENIVALVDGDGPGDGYVRELLGSNQRPNAIIQWPVAWSVEDAVRWVIEVDETALLAEIGSRIERHFNSCNELTDVLKEPDGRAGGLKTHYIAHEEIAAVIKRSAAGVQRAELILNALTLAVLNQHDRTDHLEVDNRSTASVKVYRFRV